MCVFWFLVASIEGFKSFRPLIQINDIFLYGKHKEKLLIIIFVNANGHIFPLAFAIVEEEPRDIWSWFLTTLRSHVIQREGICLIYDCYVRINVVIRNFTMG